MGIIELYTYDVPFFVCILYLSLKTFTPSQNFNEHNQLNLSSFSFFNFSTTCFYMNTLSNEVFLIFLSYIKHTEECIKQMYSLMNF